MQVQTRIAGFNAYVYSPSIGNANTPCLICIAGNGEVGTDITLLNKYLPCKFLSSGSFAPNMMVICVQPATTWPSVSWLKAIYDAVIRTYSVDINNIFLSGYSAGGTVSDAFIMQYPNLIKGIVSLSSEPVDKPANDAPQFVPWAKAGGRLLAITGANDNSNGLGFIVTTMNQAVPGSAVYVETPGEGHCCWDAKYNPAYKVNGLNIYDWCLQFVSASQPVITTPTPPLTKPSVFTATLNDGKKLTVFSDGSYTLQ